VSRRLEVVPLPTPVRVQAGEDLAALLLAAAADAAVTLQDGDVVCVASKVVARAEGATRPLPGGDPHTGRRELAREVARRVVADAPAVLVVETRHGFVCANAGIDTSNADAGTALLLPEDPDASARRIRAALRERLSVDVGIVVTDTFGRPWRSGQTDVALGVAGVAALRDERGSTDLDGRVLDVTLAAVADELAGAADLVRVKSDGTPFVLVRGAGLAGDGSGQDLVRAATDDLFRYGGPTATEMAVAGRRTVRSFAPDPVPASVLDAAVAAAVTAPAPHHTRPWRFLDLAPDTRARLLDAMAAQWRADLTGDGVDPARIVRRVARSDAILRSAPTLLAAFVDLDGRHPYPDDRRTTAERDLFVLAAGAALQNLQIVLAAHGFGAAWISSTAFCAPTVQATLDLPTTWAPIGMVAVGRPASPPPPRPAPDVTAHLWRR
jgi:coenzyme F420-0:L-glutamate ligase / coenzyme F420-1:gamma-L-glutamate ligase